MSLALLDALLIAGERNPMRILILLFCGFLIADRASAAPARPWETWDGCTHLASRYYDGDSFQIQHAGRVSVIRIYGADTAETDNTYAARIDEQAAYFKVTTAELLRAGTTAREFTRRFLSKPFRVITRRKIAPGASRAERIYGLVERNGASLEAMLIAAGLARANSEIADFPDANRGRARAAKLRQLEAKARQERVGLWGRAANGSLLETFKQRLMPQLGKPSAGPAPTLVNLNTAATGELEALPGVGPKTAELIIRARPLKDLAALDALPGFGEKRIAALRELVTF